MADIISTRERQTQINYAFEFYKNKYNIDAPFIIIFNEATNEWEFSKTEKTPDQLVLIFDVFYGHAYTLEKLIVKFDNIGKIMSYNKVENNG